ncbi:hypothetical protein [Hydrogenibacillus schlegelii]|uniref:hypothetical protein n=1 Tax=Hydrogenibacillus schlegelii TaxID=1484 RepID=UPI003F617FAC
MLKEIGRLAREELEAIFGTRFYLELWVKVRRTGATDRGFCTTSATGGSRRRRPSGAGVLRQRLLGWRSVCPGRLSMPHAGSEADHGSRGGILQRMRDHEIGALPVTPVRGWADAAFFASHRDVSHRQHCEAPRLGRRPEKQAMHPERRRKPGQIGDQADPQSVTKRRMPAAPK